MSISCAVTPSERISSQAFDFVASEVAKPGNVKANTFDRGNPSWSIARAETSKAWVESSLRETPMTTFFVFVASSLLANP
jgi:hypothetical protein